MTGHGDIFQTCEVAREKMADTKKTYILFKSWLEGLLSVWGQKGKKITRFVTYNNHIRVLTGSFSWSYSLQKEEIRIYIYLK